MDQASRCDVLGLAQSQGERDLAEGSSGLTVDQQREAAAALQAANIAVIEHMSRELLHEAATRAGKTLSAWVRETLVRAARRQTRR